MKLQFRGKNIEMRKMAKPIVTIAMCLVVFITTYALILPAITVEKEATESVAGLVLMPAQRFVQELEEEGTTVIVEADEGAFPLETSMVLTVIEQEDEMMESVVNAIDEAQITAETFKAIDITFYNEKGEVIEPQVPIRVKFIDSLAETAEDLAVLHIDNEGNSTVVEDVETDAEKGEISFSADSFSVYVIVKTEVIITDYLSADGNTYHIEVTLDERDAFNGAAELSVEELTEEADNYDDYLLAISESMMLGSLDEISFVRLFDIKIIQNGEIIEPVYPVQVKITYKDAVELNNDEQLSVVHFADSGIEIIQDVEISSDGTELLYEQNGFSVTATVVAANNLQDGGEYIIYTSNSNKYYAMTHYSEGRDADIVYGVEIDASATTRQTFTEQDYGSSIVWTAHNVTVGNTTYWTFSYEENGKTYYLRSYGGLMVGADSDIDETAYTNAGRYQWQIANARYNNSIINNTLRNYYSRNNSTYYLRYSDSAGGFKERDNYKPSSFYFAKVSSYTQDVTLTPTVHYVDEDGNELAVVNGRDWNADSTTSPAFLIYDIDGYDYIKTTIKTVGGTEIRPILKGSAKNWQYTTSTVQSTSITWENIPNDEDEPDRLEDIYVVYKKSAESVNGGTPKVKQTQGSQPPDDPEITKTSTVNGDGTNTIALSVTGHTTPLEVEKLADVIVIFDTSTSMRRQMGTSTTTYYDNNTPASQQSGYNTRLYIAANAVNDLAEDLIGNNTTFKDSAGNKLIRMSLISFDRDAVLQQEFTDNINDFKNTVNGLTTEAGTNWEAALQLANHLDVDPERATFVIFVTDGNPSYRTTRGNLLALDGYPEMVNDDNLDVNVANNYYFYRVLQYFGALDENDERNYNTAAEVAKSIVSHRKNLYSIGIGNSAGITRLQGLTSFAYGGNDTIGAERTKTADNQEELAEAFGDISASIVALMGHSDIKIYDGITDLTHTVQKVGLINFEEDDFNYYKGHAATAEDVANGKATAVGNMVWESWNPTDENCSEAVYNAEKGAVEWNMGTSFMPMDGYTYQVRFKVWPSQEAYDLLADLNNGVINYSDLPQEERDQIKEPTKPIEEGGFYTLKTNSTTSYTYCEATKTGDTVSITGQPSEPGSFDDVDPLELTTKPIAVKKQWVKNYVDSRQPSTSVTMDLYDAYPDENEAHSPVFKTITLDTPTWVNDSNYISYGLMTLNKVSNGTAEQTHLKVYETGHDFTLRETDDEAHYYDLAADIYRPMEINGNYTILQIVDKPAGMNDGAVYYKDSANNEYYKFDGNYYKDTNSDVILIATNSHRSYLEVTKQIQEGNSTAADMLFEYEVTFTIPENIYNYATEQYIFASVYDENGNAINHLTDLEKTDGFWVPSELAAEIGASVSYYSRFDTTQRIVVSGETFTMKLKPGWNIRFVNLPNETTYSIQEINIPEGYEFVDANVSGTMWEEEFDANGRVYSPNRGSEKPIPNLPISNTDNSPVTGTIDYANAHYSAQYTNRSTAKIVKIQKVDSQSDAVLPGAAFEMTRLKNGSFVSVSNFTSKTEGNSFSLIPGIYRLTEKKAPEGYIIENNVTYFQVEEGDNGGIKLIKLSGNAYVDAAAEDYPDASIVNGELTVKIKNHPGAVLPSTGGLGHVDFLILGSSFILAGGIVLAGRKRNKS